MSTRLLTIFVCSLIGTGILMAKEAIPENFMVVIREAENAQHSSVMLKPEYPQTAEIDGEVVEINMAWFSLIGDTQIRFVFDSETTMANVDVDEFLSYELSPQEAIDTAVTNIEKSYGIATYSKWQEGIYIVEAGSDDLASSHFLNDRLWLKVEEEFPDGIVAAIPDRGTLLFAPLADENASSLLVNNVQRLMESSEAQGVSRYSYIRVNNEWELVQFADNN